MDVTLRRNSLRHHPMVLPSVWNCTHSRLLAEDLVIRLASFLQFLIACITVISFGYLCREIWVCRRPLAVSSLNMRVIFISIVVFILVHSFGVGSLKMFALIRSFVLVNDCDHQWRTRTCLSFKFPIYWSVFGFTCCHMALLIERAMATVSTHRYSQLGKFPGIFLLIFTFFSAFYPTYLVYKTEDLNALRPFCTSTTSKSVHRLGNAMISIVALDILITAGDLFILVENKYRMKRRNEDYSLSKAARLNENLLSIRLIVPLSIAHSLFFIFFFGVILINRHWMLSMDPVNHIRILEFNHTMITSLMRFFLFWILALSVRSFVIRLNEAGLDDLAEYTRQWMFETLKEMQLESYSHRFERGLATGELELGNLSIHEFSPPLIKYRPNGQSLLYISTIGGDAKLYADWTIRSNVLSLLGIPLHGTATGHISGFSSSIAVKIEKAGELVAHQCVARFDGFDLRLTGSLAAEILHWFRSVIGRVMQSRVEQGYCKLVSDRLLPWLRSQLAKFPKSLNLSFARRLGFSQDLVGISATEHHLDLQMRNRFETNGHIVETVSNLPRDDPTANGKGQMLEVFLDENTVQEMLTTGHYAGELVANISSAFLRTDCDVLCLGKLVPELRAALGPTALHAEIFTNEPPIIRLMDRRALLYLNVTFGLFEESSRVPVDSMVFDDAPMVVDESEVPVLQIEVISDAELSAEMRHRRLHVELNLQNARATLVQTRIHGLSAKAVDVIVSVAAPFLENATEHFLGRGAQLDELFRIPSDNESVLIEQGFVHIAADTNIRNLL